MSIRTKIALFALLIGLSEAVLLGGIGYSSIGSVSRTAAELRRISLAVEGARSLNALLANVAAMVRRYLIVVPSQTHGLLLPYEPGEYTPNGVEMAVVAGLAAAALLIYLVSIKVIPVMSVQTHATLAESSEESTARRWIRRGATWGTLLMGMVLAGLGVALGAGWNGKGPGGDNVPYAAVVFIVGIMLSLSSAVVYEVLPTGTNHK